MLIRRALPADGRAIHAIAQRFHVQRIPEDLNAGQGFLLNLHPEEEYARRIEASPNCVVAETEGVVAGFITAYPIETCRPWIDARDVTYAYILEQAGPEDLLLDQIGVLPEFIGRQVAASLYREFERSASGRAVWLDIVHGPVRNQRSVRFFHERFGFRLVREMSGGPLRFGVYRKDAGLPPQLP